MDKRSKSVVNGIILIALAVCLLLWKLNMFNLPVEFAGVSTWGLIVTAIMVYTIIHSIIDLSFGGIFVPLAIIGIIFDKPLGITAITPWTILIVAILLTVAFDMIFPKHHRHHHHHHDDMKDFAKDHFTEETKDDNDGYVMHSMRFGSSTKYIRSQNLRVVDLTSQFGELSVFFDGAQVSGKNLSVHCNVSFGEMDLYIPKEWRIKNKVGVMLGNCDERTSGEVIVEDPIICEIDGSVSFGELKITRI